MLGTPIEQRPWFWTRHYVARRDKHTCKMCGKRRGDDGFEVSIHHILPRSQGGTDALDNLMTLCRSCHDGIHGQRPKRKKKSKK